MKKIQSVFECIQKSQYLCLKRVKVLSDDRILSLYTIKSADNAVQMPLGIWRNSNEWHLQLKNATVLSGGKSLSFFTWKYEVTKNVIRMDWKAWFSTVKIRHWAVCHAVCHAVQRCGKFKMLIESIWSLHCTQFQNDYQVKYSWWEAFITWFYYTMSPILYFRWHLNHLPLQLSFVYNHHLYFKRTDSVYHYLLLIRF